MPDPELTLFADFNNFQEDGSLPVLLPDDGPVPAEGDEVRLDDGEGNYAFATLMRVEDGAALAEVDWDSWTPAEEPQQLTAKGYAIPVPQRADFFANLEKVALAGRESSAAPDESNILAGVAFAAAAGGIVFANNNIFRGGGDTVVVKAKRRRIRNPELVGETR